MAWTVAVDAMNITHSGPLMRGYVPQRGTGSGTVTESAIVYHDTRSSGLTYINAINQTFLQARERQKSRRGTPKYIVVTPSGSGNTYRSEIMDGWVEITPAHMATFDTDSHIEFVVYWTRQSWWERADANPITLNMDAANYSASASPVINQFKGSSRDNYLTPLDMVGDLPVPIRLTLTPTSTSAIPPKWIFAGVWRDFNMALPSYTQWIEPTAGTLLSSGTTEAGSNVINSNFARWSWSGSTEKTLFSFDYSAAALQVTSAQIFRMFGLMKPNADVWVKLGLYRTWPAETLLAETQYTLVSSLSGGSWFGAFDLGTAQLPPSTSTIGALELDYGTLRVKGFGRYYGGGTLQLDWDALSIMPLDSYRSFYMSENTTALGAGGLIDLNGIKERYLAKATASDAVEVVTPYGTPLMLYPGTTNRIYLLHQQGAVAGSALEWTVGLSYRPRYSTIGA